MIQSEIRGFVENMKIPQTREEGLKIFELLHKGLPSELAHEAVLGKEDSGLSSELRLLLEKVIVQNTEIRQLIDKQKVVYRNQGQNEEDSLKMAEVQVLVELPKGDKLKSYLGELGVHMESEAEIEDAVEMLSKLGENK